MNPIAPDLLLNAFDEPLLLLDGTTVLRANAAARALLGDYLVNDDIRLAIRNPEAARLIEGGEGTVALAGIGGHERRWELTLRALADGTRLLRLEDRSSQHAAEKMRTDFVANASHELRTPLAALIGIVETLEYATAPEDAADRVRFLAIMAGEARRMQRLIEDLMSLSRIEADRFVPPRDVLDLSEIVHSAGGEIKDRARLDITLPAAAPIVHGDRAQLLQLVDNIVNNGFKYGSVGGRVRLRLESGDRQARLIVADEGEGIAPEHLPRLTERFYRVAASRSRALGGTGLGLAIVKHIVERHRGRLDIASERGRGTTVTVTLPLADDGI